MLVMPSVEIQNQFGTVSRTVSRGEAVTVTLGGEPSMVILPYVEGAQAWHEYKVNKMTQFVKNMQPVCADAPELSLAEINDLVHELRP